MSERDGRGRRQLPENRFGPDGLTVFARTVPPHRCPLDGRRRGRCENSPTARDHRQRGARRHASPN
jgi:hypothetical protein